LGDEGKRRAAEAALELEEYKESEVVGIGTGSTVAHLISLIPEKDFEEKTFVASSMETALSLKKRGAKVLEGALLDKIDIYIDGADAVDGEGNLVKGGGAALFREKILASMSDFFAVIVDESKLVESLKYKPIPIEVNPFALSYVLRKLREMELRGEVRKAGSGKYGPVVSDSFGIIVDLDASDWKEGIEELDRRLRNIVGVVETGLFIGMADAIIMGGEEAVVRKLSRRRV
jgi:ribose 5-phosphate isomerase A